MATMGHPSRRDHICYNKWINSVAYERDLPSGEVVLGATVVIAGAKPNTYAIHGSFSPVHGGEFIHFNTRYTEPA